MSLRLSLHVIVHTLLFYNIPRIILCVESNDPYRVQITLALTRSIIYYIQREIVESWARKNDVIMHSFAVSFIILDLLLFFFKAERWSPNTRSRSNVNVKSMCTGGLWGQFALLALIYRHSNVDSRNGRNARCSGRGTLKYYPNHRCVLLHRAKIKLLEFKM